MNLADPPERLRLTRETAIVRALPLIGIALAALAVRLLWIEFLTGPIESEGTEYARLAENLLNRRGYVGLATPGSELLFPPFYPLLIATVSFVTEQLELAGRLVSTAMGTMLVPIVYGIARDSYDRKTGYIAALLVAFHPLLVNLSATVYVESTYFTLVLSGAYFVLRMRQFHRARDGLLAGACFGFAYLTRLEAILYPFLAGFLVLAEAAVSTRRELLRAAQHAGILVCTTLLVAAPYVTWLSVTTGQFRFEGKSPIIHAIGSAILAGANADEVSYGVSPDLEERGVWMRPNVDVLRADQFRFSDAVRYAITQAKHNVQPIVTDLTNGISFGSPLLFALTILGLFARAWRRELAVRQLFLFMLVAVAGLGALSHFAIEARYHFLFLPVMLIWASAGMMALSRWTAATARSIGVARRPGKHLAITAQCAVGGMLLLVALKGEESVWAFRTFDQQNLAVKTAGQWLEHVAPGPKTVMENFGVVTFYAHAAYVQFPYSDVATALRYIDHKHVDFIALEEDWMFGRPYLRDWLEKGIPDPRAQLIYSVVSKRIGRIVIYRWTSGAPASG